MQNKKQFLFLQTEQVAAGEWALSGVDPYYGSLESSERSKEFRRSILSIFFAKLWTLSLRVGLEAGLHAGELERKERQFGSPEWQKGLMDPLQINSFRMVVAGGDLGRTLLENVLDKTQKKALKSVRFGAGCMYTYTAHFAGQVYVHLGFRNYGNFLLSQAPFLGQMILSWIEKRRSDRIAEIFGWIGLALFLATTVAA